MIQLKINNETLNIPTSWTDFTVGHIQNLFTVMESAENWSTDFIFRLAHYTGLEYEFLNACNFTSDQIINLMQLCEFERDKITDYIAPMQNALQFYIGPETKGWIIRVPKEESNFNTRELVVPGNISEKYVGAKIVFEKMVFPEYEKTGSLVNVLHLALAIYFQPLFYSSSKFDTDQVLELAEICKRCKFTEALPIGDFFLKKWQHFAKKKVNSVTRRH